MAIDFIPYDELFAHDYQLNYISVYGDIVVGPYTYNVFKEYTVAERQKIFQDCAKWLNWQVSEIQEEWELCMYVYQWIIKSPPPFPYEQYTLSEEIKMAINWELEISNVNLSSKRADVSFVRTDSLSALPPQVYSFNNTYIETPEQRVALLETVKYEVEREETHQANVDAIVTDLEQSGKAALEAWEATR